MGSTSCFHIYNSLYGHQLCPCIGRLVWLGIMYHIFLCSGGTPQQQLLVLHPRRIMVYSVAVTSGRNRSAQAGKQGMQAKLMPAYQHSLSRQAYCAVIGECATKMYLLKVFFQ